MNAKRLLVGVALVVAAGAIALYALSAFLSSLTFGEMDSLPPTLPPLTATAIQPTVEAEMTRSARATEEIRATAGARATAFAQSPIQPLDPPLTVSSTPLGLESVAFSPDGKTVAAFTPYTPDAATVFLWDAATHELIGSLVVEAWVGQFTYPFQFSNLAFSPDGRLLAMGSCARREEPVLGECELGKISLWDVATRQLRGQPLLGHTDAVASVAFSPAGAPKMLASADCGPEILLWDVTTGEALDPFVREDSSFCTVAFSPDGRLLAAQDGRTILLWDVATREPVGPPLTTGAVHDFAFSPDGELLASVSDGSLILWDIAAREPLGTPLSGDGSYLALSPNGRWLATAGSDETVRLWEIATRKAISVPLAASPRDWYVGSLAFSPDGRALAAIYGGVEIILLDLTQAPAAFQSVSAAPSTTPSP